MKFSIKDFFSKSDQIRSFLWIWSHLLKKSLMENARCRIILFLSVFCFCQIFAFLMANLDSFHNSTLKLKEVFFPHLNDIISTLLSFYLNSVFVTSIQHINPTQDGPFRVNSRLGGNPSKIYHTYPTMMKLSHSCTSPREDSKNI